MLRRALGWIGLVAVLGLAVQPTWTAAWSSPAVTPDAFRLAVADAMLFDCVADRLRLGAAPYGDPAVEACLVDRVGAPLPHGLPFQYPPSTLPLFALLGLVDARTGVVASTMIGLLLCFAAALVWLRPADLRGRAALLLGLGWGRVARLNATLGQTGTWVGAAALGLAAARRPWVVGLLLAALGAKPQYAVPVALLLAVRGRWRALAVAAAVTVGCFAGVEVWLGPGVTVAWLRAAGGHNDTLASMATWRSLAPAFREPALDAVAVALWGAVSVALAVGTRGLLWERALAVTLPVAAALSPNSHPYDLVLWSLPAAVVARDRGVRPEVGVLVLHAALLVWSIVGFLWLPDLAWRRVLAPVAIALGAAAWRGARHDVASG